MWPFDRKKTPQIENPDQFRKSTERGWSSRRCLAMPGEGSDQRPFIQILSVLSPDESKAIGGIPGEAIVGFIGDAVKDPETLNAVTGQEFSAEEFRPNPTFTSLMQHVIGTLGPTHPRLIETAREQGHGSVGIIDLRTPEGVMGAVPMAGHCRYLCSRKWPAHNLPSE